MTAYRLDPDEIGRLLSAAMSGGDSPRAKPAKPVPDGVNLPDPEGDRAFHTETLRALEKSVRWMENVSGVIIATRNGLLARDGINLGPRHAKVCEALERLEEQAVALQENWTEFVSGERMFGAEWQRTESARQIAHQRERRAKWGEMSPEEKLMEAIRTAPAADEEWQSRADEDGEPPDPTDPLGESPF